MFKVTSAVRPTERVTVTPPRWRWYHAAIFYGVVQVLAFGLSGLVSLARGNRGKSLRETNFGDVPYFEHLKQAKITPPSWAFGPAWLVNNISVLWLIVALTAATFQALWNYDDFYRVGPFLQPRAE